MNATSPYNPTLAADIVLRTSDDVDFYVIGPFLRFVSPVFMDMYTLNHGPAAEENEKKDGRPLIRLEEDSRTLRLLLDTIYPYAKDPPLTDVSLFWKIGKASKKYIMDVIEEKLQLWIVSSDLIATSPLRIYAIAIDLGWEGVAMEAARRTLQTPLEKLGHVEELRSIPASGFYRFLEYRLRCDTSSSPRTETLMTLHEIGAAGTTERLAQVLHLECDMDADATTDAPEPFNSSKESDLILRSSDSVNFFVLKSLIHLVSPQFDQVFPSRSKADDGKIVIHVTQDSKVLRQLLSIIYYYIDELDIRDFQLYIAVAEAAHYCKMAVIEKKLRKLILNSPLIMKEPLKLYVLATVLRWEDVVKLAALNTLSLPLQEMIYIGEFSRISGEDLYRLINFRFKCGEAARESLEADAGFMQFGPSNWGSAWPYQSINGLPTMEVLKEKIKACPRGSTLESIYVSAISELKNSYNSYSNYGASTSQVAEIMICYRRMGDTIEEAVSKVPFFDEH
ncbi:hypothetical protein M378DRAFT_21413 [Amanita muscaria Koide BX008]|uniref:BTB domain-containing protein n=1 Tax=Amanita muscaria (strain Koide BX008) TaxID=946122 RepID=A0A0C2T076_AMAMK|nr:hypothetical protein M378DRAFT_21413 [Amanita muscaria Koide BX008]